jgi:hypothetical protein
MFRRRSVPHCEHDVAQHRFSGVRTWPHGLCGRECRIPYTGCRVFCEVGKDGVEPVGLTLVVQVTSAALVNIAPIVGAAQTEMTSRKLLTAHIISIHNHPRQNAGRRKPKREKKQQGPLHHAHRCDHLFVRAASTLFVGRHTRVRFGTDQSHALVFHICTALQWPRCNFGYRDGPHDANAGPRSNRLIVNRRFVGSSNPYLYN